MFLSKIFDNTVESNCHLNSANEKKCAQTSPEALTSHKESASLRRLKAVSQPLFSAPHLTPALRVGFGSLIHSDLGVMPIYVGPNGAQSIKQPAAGSSLQMSPSPVATLVTAHRRTRVVFHAKLSAHEMVHPPPRTTFEDIPSRNDTNHTLFHV